MATYRQSSFEGGMLSPSLEGRTDFDKRLAGARRIHNFIVTPFGTLRRRAGIRFLAEVFARPGQSAGAHLSSQSRPAAGDDAVRLITFRNRDSEDTLLVLAHHTCRAIPNGILAASHEFSTPWPGSALTPDPFDGSKPGIKWSQSGNRILVTHPDYEPTYLIAPTEGTQWRTGSGADLVSAPEVSSFTAEYIAAGR